MAVNPFAGGMGNNGSGWSPEVAQYVNSVSANQFRSDTPNIAGYYSQSVNNAANRKAIEWANQQKMMDPAYWAQAFSANSGGNTLGSLVTPQNFDQSDAYKWNFEQGREAVNRTAAAKRMLGSGNRLSELTKFGQGLASQEYGNEFNRQLSLKQLEQNQRAQNMQMGMNAMQSMKRYMPPGQFQTAGGVATRWD